MERTLDRYGGAATFEMADDSFTAECEFVVRQEMISAGRDVLPGLIAWRGSFTTGDRLASPGEGTLTLADGRKGSVIITHLMYSHGYGTFTGSGSPPA